MTQKFIGKIEIARKPDGGLVVIMPSGTSIPDKKEWSKHPIWQFNGKAYKPLTKNAEENLDCVVKSLEADGYSSAIKEGKRKPSSLRYAILTTGIEPFICIK